MDSLCIDNGLKEIKVNDAGECIEFSVNDSGFYKRFTEFVQWFKEQDGRQEINDLREKVKVDKKDEGSESLEEFYDASNIQYAICKEACEKIDSIFGQESCRKVFGNIVPDLLTIANFLEAVTPFIDKYIKERNQAINKKYSKSRKGAKS